MSNAEPEGSLPRPMHRPGAQQMHFLRELIESRPFFTRVPDDTLIQNARAFVGPLHLTASRDRDGRYAFIYFPTSDQSATIELGHLRQGELRGWWYDPRTGFAHPLGKFPGASAREFKSPSYGPDWVLVLDSVAENYLPPGTPQR